jgi:SWI/SNF-related matrix-associated actin-dependent regulator 1 of chromatin subfamily A
MMDMQALLGGIVADAVIENDVLDGDFELVHPVSPFEFFDYQLDSLDFVLRRGVLHSYLALDMGLGKSLVAWALAATVKADVPDRYKRPVLLVTPPALRRNIVREGAKFYPHLKVHTILTSEPADGEQIPDVDVIVIGDASLKGEIVTDPKTRRKEFIPSGWAKVLAGSVDAIVVDEAHRHKNNSARSNALSYVSSMCAGFKVLMSGTPFPNGRNGEIARQIEVMGQAAWSDIGGKGHFYSHYAPITDERYGVRTSKNNLDLFHNMSASWYFRRLRDDVVELPNKARSFIGLEGTGKGARDYLRAETDLISYLRDEEKNVDIDPRAEALVRMNNLRRLAGVARMPQVAAHVKDILEADKDSDSPTGVLIIAEHGEVLDYLISKLRQYWPTTIRGGMTENDRDEAVDQFNSGQSRVLIGQITSAGTGFTLHGDGKNHRVVFAQLPWTPAEVRQAEDRLHRIGQTHDVMVELTGAVIEKAADGTTIDERLWSALSVKAFSAGQVQDGKGDVLIDQSSIENAVMDSYR